MVAEPIVGIESRVAIEFVQRTMELVAAALGINENHNARAATIFRIEIACESLEFAHGVKAQGGVFTVVCTYIGVDYAIEEEVVSGPAHSVHVEVVGLVKDEAKLGVIVRDHSGRRCQQRFEVASIQRLLDNLP